MDISIKVSKKGNRIGGLAARLHAEAASAVRHAVELIGEYADPETPVLTGALKASRVMTFDEATMRGGQQWTATNSSGQPYGRYVNDGTIHMPARPYATDAQAKAQKWLRAELKSIMSGDSERVDAIEGGS